MERTRNVLLQSKYGRAAQLGEALDEIIPDLLRFVGNADAERVEHLVYDSTGNVKAHTSLIHPLSSSRANLEQALTSVMNLDEIGLGNEGLRRTVKSILKYSVNPSAPGFLDKLYAAPLPPGIVAELVLGVINTNVHVRQVSPVLTSIEKKVTRDLSHMFGFQGSRSGGISVQGGSASNMTAIVIARNTLYPQTKVIGNGAVQGQLLLYTSTHGHYSIEKAAQALGLGSENVVDVPVDEEGRMIPEELSAMVEKAKNEGKVPFFVNATAGTTVLGSFDPFKEIAKIAWRHSMWLHIDGAWGGSFTFSNNAELKGKLDGVELADSIAINPHKMLGVPVTCSFLLGKDMRKFQAANTLKAGYLFHEEVDDDNHRARDKNGMKDQYGDEEQEDWNEPHDLADLTLQCGRRGDSLKLFLSWKYYGTHGYGRMIDDAYHIACHMLNLVHLHPDLTPVLRGKKPSCLQVCFYFTPGGKFSYGTLDRAGCHKPGMHISDDENRNPTQFSTRLGKLNSQVTMRIAKTLIERGFMIDFAPALEGQQDRGHFFRVVINISTINETTEKLIDELVRVGKSIVKEEEE